MKRCFAAFTSHYLLAQFIHLREVPDGRASQGGCVLHKHHLALVLVHGDHLPVQGLGPDVMKGHAAADVCSCCRPAADCTRCSLLSSWKSPEPVAACCRCCSQFCPRQSRIVLERLRWEILKLLPILLHFRLMSPKWLSWLGHRVRTMTVGLDAE